jgi:hypothetical protein
MNKKELLVLTQEREDAFEAKREAERTIQHNQAMLVRVLIEAGYYDVLTVNWTRLNELIRSLS